MRLIGMNYLSKNRHDVTVELASEQDVIGLNCESYPSWERHYLYLAWLFKCLTLFGLSKYPYKIKLQTVFTNF
ncbi:23151_t:CDS:2 [Dentiscutata erythropus]|uniref:23151_t:CDS:1 n=1 Tax=Dentiscutata erythropus TaxID=1348616 RepID=A0A9N9DQN7_9GLOM|nr:23151_t:CDS:2 [Dentiscutata erythropus]